MTVTLDTLELTPEELESTKDTVRRMAYFNWLNAGCPDHGQLDFWLAAQREWIEHDYVPSRPQDGTRPQAASLEAANGGREPAAQKAKRRKTPVAG